jgi:hypothetical protein
MRSPLLLCTSILLLSGCAYLIPDNPSTPRYSKVLGPRHAPVLNAQSMAGNGGSAFTPTDPGVTSVTAAAPTSQIVAVDNAPPAPTSYAPPMPSAFPPVAPETQARADAILASSGRQMPAENPGGMDIATTSFDNVLPRPLMGNVAGSDEQQLNAVREQLERDRAGAQSVHQQLNRDAASEPSLLPSSGTPVSLPPAAIPAGPESRFGPSSSAVPAPGYVAPTPLLPPPPVAASGVPAFASAAPMYAPMPSGLEPMILRPPVGGPASVPAPILPPQNFAEAPPPLSMVPSSSGFNPMADSGPYLPSARYTR